MVPPTVPTSAREALNAAYLRLEPYGPEYGAQHQINRGSVTVEALSELGRSDAISPWVEKYLPQLELESSSAPPPDGVATPRQSEPPAEALGDFKQFATWRAWFEQELQGPKRDAVLDRWISRLAPGAAAAMGHALLRTAHAARALKHDPGPERLSELAEGLAYWASRYQPLGESSPAPSPGNGEGSSSVAAALRQVIRHPLSQDNLPVQEALLQASREADFGKVPALLTFEHSTDERVSDLIRCFVHLYSSNIDNEESVAPKTSDLAYVQAISAVSGVRLLASSITPDTQRLLLHHLWVFCAATYSAFSHLPLADDVAAPPEPEPGVGEIGGRFGELIDEAILGANPLGIAFTEVCVREVRAGASRELLVLSRLAVARVVVADLKRKQAEKRARKLAKR